MTVFYICDIPLRTLSECGLFREFPMSKSSGTLDRPFPAVSDGRSAKSREKLRVLCLPSPAICTFRQICKPNLVKQKMNLIVLLRITFANCRKPLSHKVSRAETQPFDRGEDGIV